MRLAEMRRDRFSIGGPASPRAGIDAAPEARRDAGPPARRITPVSRIARNSRLRFVSFVPSQWPPLPGNLVAPFRPNPHFHSMLFVRVLRLLTVLGAALVLTGAMAYAQAAPTAGEA